MFSGQSSSLAGFFVYRHLGLVGCNIAIMKRFNSFLQYVFGFSYLGLKTVHGVSKKGIQLLYDKLVVVLPFLSQAELLGICNRIIVMHEGHLKGEINDTSTITQKDILKMAIS